MDEKFRTPHHFREITKACIYLPEAQNDVLMRNLKTEASLLWGGLSGELRSIFTYKNQVVNVVRDLRVAQRPLFVAVATLDKMLSDVRVAAKSLSFSYPVQPHLLVVQAMRASFRLKPPLPSSLPRTRSLGPVSTLTSWLTPPSLPSRFLTELLKSGEVPNIPHASTTLIF